MLGIQLYSPLWSLTQEFRPQSFCVNRFKVKGAYTQDLARTFRWSPHGQGLQHIDHAITMTPDHSQNRKQRLFHIFSPFATAFLFPSTKVEGKERLALVRPLLALSRHDVKQLCQFWRMPIYPDRTNEQLRFSRNRVRKQLLPMLRSFFNPQIDGVLSQLGEILLLEQLYTELIHDKLNRSSRPLGCLQPPTSLLYRATARAGERFLRNPVLFRKDGQARPSEIQVQQQRWQNKGLYPSLSHYVPFSIKCKLSTSFHCKREKCHSDSMAHETSSYQLPLIATELKGFLYRHKYFYLPKVGSFVRPYSQSYGVDAA